jgi:septal ring factor EnvC (AmiA/AmiB activator)
MDTAPIVEVESQLAAELESLTSRLEQGKRDHQRSHDELQRLEADIRDTERELRAHRRENLPSPYTEEQLAGACDAVVLALRAGINPQSHAQLTGTSRLDSRLVTLAATRLTREGRVTIEQHRKEDELIWLS